MLDYMQIIENLKQGEGKIIAQQAKEGNKYAQRVISAYQLFARCVEPVALAVFEGAYDDYKKNVTEV